MSDALAIAAITNILRQVLIRGITADVPGIDVTTRPLDKARTDGNGSQVNLFLYHALPNAAWRNMDVPWRHRVGETGYPPLALNLHYLVTAYYGQNEDDIDTTTDNTRILGSHRLIGLAMAILHDHPVLDAEAINDLLPENDRLNHPYDQLENVRITPVPLTLDEVSKLWSGFQTQYRLSAAYNVSAVLIESARQRPKALPVIRRGDTDGGAFVQAGQPPYILSVQPPGSKAGAEPGDRIVIKGLHLDNPDITVRFRHRLLDEALELVPTGERTAAKLEVQIPDTAADSQMPGTWVPGVYNLTLQQKRPSLPVVTSNTIPMALAPRIVDIDPRNANPGPVSLKVQCIPQIREDQQVVLVLVDREIPSQAVDTPPDPAQATTVTFDFDIDVSEAPPDVYVVRLRVDGIDSIPVIFSDTAPPEFDDNQKVTIQP